MKKNKKKNQNKQIPTTSQDTGALNPSETSAKTGSLDLPELPEIVPEEEEILELKVPDSEPEAVAVAAQEALRATPVKEPQEYDIINLKGATLIIGETLSNIALIYEDKKVSFDEIIGFSMNALLKKKRLEKIKWGTIDEEIKDLEAAEVLEYVEAVWSVPDLPPFLQKPYMKKAVTHGLLAYVHGKEAVLAIAEGKRAA